MTFSGWSSASIYLLLVGICVFPSCWSIIPTAEKFSDINLSFKKSLSSTDTGNLKFANNFWIKYFNISVQQLLIAEQLNVSTKTGTIIDVFTFIYHMEKIIFYKFKIICLTYKFTFPFKHPHMNFISRNSVMPYMLQRNNAWPPYLL